MDRQTQTSRPLRVSAVSFLNGRPLYHSLVGDKAPAWDDGAAMFEVQLDLPSVCADRLERGEVDVGLVPVAAYAAHPDWEVVPGIGIGCRGRVETVVVASRVPLESVERIWLDDASRTSVILLQLLLRERGLSPELPAIAHGEGEAKIGDQVAIVEGRPLSRRKRWTVTRVVRKATRV